MTVILIIGFVCLIILGWAAWVLYRTRPIRTQFDEPEIPPALPEFRRVTGHHYRMRLPDNLKLRMKR